MSKILSIFGGSWLIPAVLATVLAIAGVYVAGLKSALSAANTKADKFQTDLVQCKVAVDVQNQHLDMFREESRIMGENLKKHREAAAKRRLEGDKRAKSIMDAPSEKTCQEAIGKAVRSIQDRYKSE